ncbi:MAG: hypothetical protein IJS19_00330 [Muribaculaceae bacterium]|nr:hypothetical protein [Muribaculaceae bacterium]
METIYSVNVVERNDFDLNSIVRVFRTKADALKWIKILKNIYKPIIKECNWETDYEAADGLSAGEDGRYAENSIVINLKQHKL